MDPSLFLTGANCSNINPKFSQMVLGRLKEKHEQLHLSGLWLACAPAWQVASAQAGADPDQNRSILDLSGCLHRFEPLSTRNWKREAARSTTPFDTNPGFQTHVSP